VSVGAGSNRHVEETGVTYVREEGGLGGREGGREEA